jgi:signal transduction histidine kinase
MPVRAAFATVTGMRATAVPADPDLPLARRLAAHRFSPAQLVTVDVVVVAAITAAFVFLRPMRAPTLSGTTWDTVSWVAFAVASVVTPLRRRLPRGTLAVVLAAALLGLGLQRGGATTFYVVLALYSVVAVSSRRAALIIAGLVTGAVLAATIAGGGAMVVPLAIGDVALVLLGWLAGENTRAGRVYEAQRAERAAEKAAAAEAGRAAQVRRAMADERAQIARELHDIVAHAMSVIAVRSGVARMVIDTDPEQAREALGIIETTTRRSLHEMRLLVGVLRDTQDQPAELAPLPGLADLDRLVTASAAAGVTADVAVDGTVRPLPAAADLSAYRIVQEALTNVARHAGPTRAHIRIGYQPHVVTIEVADDGPRGPVPTPAARAGSGHGLIGMRERAALFGGELAAGPHGSGFRVRAALPTADGHGGGPPSHDPGGESGGAAVPDRDPDPDRDRDQDRDRGRGGVPAGDGAR